MFVMIVGCGRIGSMLAQDLAKEGYNVTVIDQDREKLESLGSSFNGVTVEGIGIDEEILVKAGIKEADVFLAVSQEDNINMMAAQIAKNIFHVPKVIARNYKVELNDFYKKLGLNTIYPLQNIVELVKNKVLYDEVEVVSELESSQLMCIKYEMPSMPKEMWVEDFEEKYELKILQVRRKGKTYYPKRTQVLKEGDQMILSVYKDKIDLLRTKGI